MTKNMTVIGPFRRSGNGLVGICLAALLLTLSVSEFAQNGNLESGDGQILEIEHVHINRADADTIARVLDGVGVSRAQAIINYRETYGEFTNLDDLMQVKGIGQATLDNNEPRIRFD